jgi:hypothetical protein
MICNKSGKSTAKNPSIKAECPFYLHYERKSFLTHQLRKHKGININSKDVDMIKEEPNEDSDIINGEKGDSKFDSKKFKKHLKEKT